MTCLFINDFLLAGQTIEVLQGEYEDECAKNDIAANDISDEEICPHTKKEPCKSL